MNTDLDALLSNDQVDNLTAYRDCLIVMLHCAPLRKTEMLSITPENAEVWQATDGTQHYGWRYKSTKSLMNNSENNNIILIPDSLVPIAQKAIIRLRELYSEDLVKNYLERCNSVPELRIDFSEYRKSYAESTLKNFGDLNSTAIFEFFKSIDHKILSQYYLAPNSTPFKPSID